MEECVALQNHRGDGKQQCHSGRVRTRAVVHDCDVKCSHRGTPDLCGASE